MPRRIVILGSTGSIGTQALQVLREHEEDMVYGLSCGRNLELLRQQIAEFNPVRIVVQDCEAARQLQR